MSIGFQVEKFLGLACTSALLLCTTVQIAILLRRSKLFSLKGRTHLVGFAGFSFLFVCFIDPGSTLGILPLVTWDVIDMQAAVCIALSGASLVLGHFKASFDALKKPVPPIYPRTLFGGFWLTVLWAETITISYLYNKQILDLIPELFSICGLTVFAFFDCWGFLAIRRLLKERIEVAIREAEAVRAGKSRQTRAIDYKRLLRDLNRFHLLVLPAGAACIIYVICWAILDIAYPNVDPRHSIRAVWSPHLRAWNQLILLGGFTYWAWVPWKIEKDRNIRMPDINEGKEALPNLMSQQDANGRSSTSLKSRPLSPSILGPTDDFEAHNITETVSNTASQVLTNLMSQQDVDNSSSSSPNQTFHPLLQSIDASASYDFEAQIAIPTLQTEMVSFLASQNSPNISSQISLLTDKQ